MVVDQNKTCETLFKIPKSLFIIGTLFCDKQSSLNE